MVGILRAAVATGRLSAPRLPSSLTQTNRSIPFVPTDWVFRYFPWFSRDKVRFMLRFNQISFFMGLGYFYLWCHTPYKSDSYEHFWESPLYRYVRGNLEKTGELEENLRVKVHHFYPQEPEADE
eukprot:TRINITY_DN1906_c0_g1_i3.p2 TRINITY_DN1906_c0_g1~~TRINITY_DN1906_c0_g1_i3.p2  ORF type:complete len:124 (+),score=19.49 TRINITY_DN1906_c0_g1_i3:66-437(+)